jgi:hypothetical protein
MRRNIETLDDLNSIPIGTEFIGRFTDAALGRLIDNTVQKEQNVRPNKSRASEESLKTLMNGNEWSLALPNSTVSLYRDHNGTYVPDGLTRCRAARSLMGDLSQDLSREMKFCFITKPQLNEVNRYTDTNRQRHLALRVALSDSTGKEFNATEKREAVSIVKFLVSHDRGIDSGQYKPSPGELMEAWGTKWQAAVTDIMAVGLKARGVSRCSILAALVYAYRNIGEQAIKDKVIEFAKELKAMAGGDAPSKDYPHVRRFFAWATKDFTRNGGEWTKTLFNGATFRIMHHINGHGDIKENRAARNYLECAAT